MYRQLLAILVSFPILLPMEDNLFLSLDQSPHPLQLVSDRLAYLKQHLEMQGLSERAAELIIESWRRNRMVPITQPDIII